MSYPRNFISKIVETLNIPFYVRNLNVAPCRIWTWLFPLIAHSLTAENMVHSAIIGSVHEQEFLNHARMI